MKTARIGAIMPWGGDGSEGFTAANIPKAVSYTHLTLPTKA